MNLLPTYTNDNIQFHLEHTHHELVVATEPDTYDTNDRHLRQLSIFTEADGEVKQQTFFETTLSKAEVMKFALYIILDVRRGRAKPVSQSKLGYLITIFFGIERMTADNYAINSLVSLATVLLDCRGHCYIFQQKHVQLPVGMLFYAEGVPILIWQTE